jgi:hypothetical protein
MSKPLNHLSDEKKALLKQLTSRFDLDWKDAKIQTGDEARRSIKVMDDMRDRIDSRATPVVVMATAERQNVLKPGDKPKWRPCVNRRENCSSWRL